jgi:hypothetical protein
MEQYTYIQLGASVLFSVVNAEVTILPVAAIAAGLMILPSGKSGREIKAFLLAGKPCKSSCRDCASSLDTRRTLRPSWPMTRRTDE